MVITHHLWQHFRPEEHYFVERMLDTIASVEETYSLAVTDFLNPRQVKVLASLMGGRDLQLFISSAYVPSEYAKAIIAPSYYQLDMADFQMSLIGITYNAKFNQLEHHQILGALLHQSGLKRQLLGDILLTEGRAQVFVDTSMVDYLLQQVTKIARVSVDLMLLPLSTSLIPNQKGIETVILTSSFRLDKLVAEVLQLARSKSLRLIETENVLLNYGITVRPSEIVAIGDMVSVRGFGRFKLLDDIGLTKQGKHKVLVERLSRR